MSTLAVVSRNLMTSPTVKHAVSYFFWNLTTKFVLKAHSELDSVEAIGTEIVDEITGATLQRENRCEGALAVCLLLESQKQKPQPVSRFLGGVKFGTYNRKRRRSAPLAVTSDRKVFASR
jgi:hypothetical protein